jgi:dTDP-glucose 4,6-dehydratase
MNVMVTGGCGFIGSNLVKWLRKNRPTWRVVNYDKLTYAGNLENFKELENDPNHVFVKGDIGNRELVDHVIRSHKIDAIMHLAAESHVDRSILGPEAFIVTNVLGTNVLLEAARHAKLNRFLMVSTDEVYGSLGPTGFFTETTPLDPSSPYSSSKASADLITLAYEHTFGLDVVVTRCSNNYGPFQFPEKLIPLMVVNALHDRPLPVYGDGTNVRDWLHVDDHCSALVTALEKGKKGGVYNIGGNSERQNIQIVKAILGLVGKPESLIKHVTDRLGHDKRYAIDATKMKTELGWAPSHVFEKALAETVKWYVDNRPWWERVMSGEYKKYFDTQYSARLS